MAIIEYRKKRRQRALRVNRKNPLARDLLVSLPLLTPNYTSIGSNRITGTPTAAAMGVTPKGKALKLAATGQIALGTTCLLPTSTTPFTLTLYELPDATSAYSSLVGLSGGTRQWLWIRGTNVEYFCSVGRSNASASTQHFNSVGAQVAGVGHRFLITGSGGIEGIGGTYRLWMDGVEQSSELKSFGSVASGTNYIGWDGTDTKFNGKLKDFNLWGRVLSDAEIDAYFDNPDALYAPSSIWVPVSAGGGTDGNASTAPASATLTAPTATGSGSAQASTAPAGSTLTAPTATASASAQASCAPAGLTLTAPTATATGSAQAFADFMAAVLTAPTATASGASATIGRPASDASNSGWTASTGSDLYAMLDEVSPDALDYIVATSTGAVCELDLGATGYPGTASQKLSFRGSSSTGNSVIVRLKNTGGATVRSETQLLTSTDTLYEFTLTALEIADITSGALSVELESA